MIKPYLTLINSRKTHLLLYTSGTIAGILLAFSHYEPVSVDMVKVVAAPIITILLTLGIYLFNDYQEQELDRKNNKLRPLVTGKVNSEQVEILIMIGFIGAGMVAFMYYTAVFPVVVLWTINGILYTWPKKYAFGKILIVKNLIIACFYMSVIIYGLTAIEPTPFLGGQIFVVLMGSIIFVGSALSDWRDVDGDRMEGRKTIPIVLGLSKPKGYFKHLYKYYFYLYFIIPALFILTFH